MWVRILSIKYLIGYKVHFDGYVFLDPIRGRKLEHINVKQHTY